MTLLGAIGSFFLKKSTNTKGFKNILLNLNILNNNGEDIKREKASNQNKRH